MNTLIEKQRTLKQEYLKKIKPLEEECEEIRRKAREDNRLIWIDCEHNFYQFTEEEHIRLDEISKIEKELMKPLQEVNNEIDLKKRQERQEKLNQPGVRTKKSYQRKKSEAKKLKKQIEELQKELAEVEQKKEFYAMKYKQETGKNVE